MDFDKLLEEQGYIWYRMRKHENQTMLIKIYADEDTVLKLVKDKIDICWDEDICSLEKEMLVFEELLIKNNIKYELPRHIRIVAF